VEFARPLAAEPADQVSPLTSLRLQRKLTVEEAAKRAALWPEQVEWLEDGRLYRFPSNKAAVMAVLRYATALGIDHREARSLSGMPVEPPAHRPIGRWLAASTAVAVALIATLVFVVGKGGNGPTAASQRAATLPPPWKVSVDVLNGSGDINYTRRVASRIGSFGYGIQHVTKANRFDYRETAVYFEPGGTALARRLAEQIGVPIRPLPAGNNPRRLVVIVGPAHATG
jgi:LytR cell envelope-related transcriptional attenuator/helix-turn-helix protein